MVNSATYRSFSDEMKKIASLGLISRVARAGGRNLIKSLKAGWHGPIDPVTKRSAPGYGWMGAGKQDESLFERITSGATKNTPIGGGLTSKLPVGNKTMTLLGGAAMLPIAAAEEDPFGRGASRAERGLEGIGNISGGLIGTGMMARAGMGPMTSAIAGGLIGSHLGGRILSSPLAALRQRRLHKLRELQSRQLVEQQPGATSDTMRSMSMASPAAEQIGAVGRE